MLNRHSARLSSIFLLIALLPGSGLAHAGSLEGHWYGKGYQPSVRKTMQWLTINRSDGSYSVEFREYSNCQLAFTQMEEGRWTVLGDILTKKALTINGRPVRDTPYYTDTYRIIELGGLKMRIVHEKTGQDWTSERVTEDFTFPNCENVS
jgi:hypothetical protein